jgi:hypothetical protein
MAACEKSRYASGRLPAHLVPLVGAAVERARVVRRACVCVECLDRAIARNKTWRSVYASRKHTL